MWEDPLFYEMQNQEWIEASIEGMSLVQPKLVAYLNPKYPEIADAISVQLQNIVLGSPAQEAMDEAATRVKERKWIPAPTG